MVDIGARRTELLLPYAALVEEIRRAIERDKEGAVHWVQRHGVTLGSGTSVWAMIAADEDIAVNKTVTVNLANSALKRATVGGQAAVFDTRTGAPLMVLDGSTLTARRTAAVSSVAIQSMTPDAASAVVVGSGVSARAHVECLLKVNGIRSFRLYGRSPANVAKLAQFVRTLGGHATEGSNLVDDIGRSDVVLTATFSAPPVLPDMSFGEQLFVAVGAYQHSMAELPAELVRRAAGSIVVDNIAAAKSEAGDLIQAGVDWQGVRELADVVHSPLVRQPSPIIFKSVGHSLWDLAAAKLAQRMLTALREV